MMLLSMEIMVGYPAQNIDEYEDVMFEGIRVMNKKNPDNFLRTIYGENYKQWLPPVSRISHHKWTKLNYDVYKSKYDLPENYKDYLSIDYTCEKLSHMQNISFEMLSKIDEICKKNKLKYFVIGLNSYIKANNVDEYGRVWHEPLKIAMPRKDYNQLAEISEKYFNPKYFYQSKETDKEYKYSYARMRLNLTSIREAKTPQCIEEKYNDGFFIEIIPLENTSNNYEQRKKHARNIRYLNHFILLKWKKNNFRVFWKNNIKTKIKLLLLWPFNVEKLIKKLEKEIQKYDNVDTDYYVDGTGYQFNGLTIKKEILGQGNRLEYNGNKFAFPSNLEEYIKNIDNKKITKTHRKIKKLKYIKDNFSDSYLERVTRVSKKEIKRIQKKYPTCYLNYFDLPEYQLSILRYDEKTERFLSNDEILNNMVQEMVV